jgi:hypothetical protein
MRKTIVLVDEKQAAEKGNQGGFYASTVTHISSLVMPPQVLKYLEV